MHIELINSIWPDWVIDEKPLGVGSYGAVYHAHREDFGVEVDSAIKVIEIPQHDSEIASLRAEGMSDSEIEEYLRGSVNEFAREIKIMESFKGTRNIVIIEDFKILKRQDIIGWHILIKMEMLKPIISHVKENPIDEREAIKLGIDICRALEYCAKGKVIHRDIKPDNIFVSKYGDYKLGDFGVARTFSGLTSSLSQKGTLNYMAPEVQKGFRYDSTVDTYSLGLVLYRYLNRNKMPFLKVDKPTITPNERMMSVKRRMDGETFNPPCDASDAFSRVILKACAFNPRDRYQSASDMKHDLEKLLNVPAQESADNVPQATLPKPQEEQVAATPVVKAQPVPVAVPVQPVQAAPVALVDSNANVEPVSITSTVQPETVSHKEEKSKKSRKWLVPVIIILSVILLAGGSIALIKSGIISLPGSDAETTSVTKKKKKPSKPTDAPKAEGYDLSDIGGMDNVAELNDGTPKIRSYIKYESGDASSVYGYWYYYENDGDVLIPSVPDNVVYLDDAPVIGEELSSSLYYVYAYLIEDDEFTPIVLRVYGENGDMFIENYSTASDDFDAVSDQWLYFESGDKFYLAMYFSEDGKSYSFVPDASYTYDPYDVSIEKNDAITDTDWDISIKYVIQTKDNNEYYSDWYEIE